MIPKVVETGARHAYELVTGIAARSRDAQPAYELIVDEMFAFEHRWWQLTYGSKTDKEKRAGRNPEYMTETGGLHASATRKGAARQVHEAGPSFAFIGTTHGLASIHEKHGREVMGEPPRREVRHWLENVGNYVLTGRLDG